MWCRRPLRSACSPCSAGNVCWAKPNHAFFKCQQSFAKFFHAASANAARTTAFTPHARMTCRCALRRRAPHRCHARKQWRGLQRFHATRARRHGCHRNAHGTRARHIHRQPAHRCDSIQDFASHKRVCAKTARTFRGVRACAQRSQRTWRRRAHLGAWPRPRDGRRAGRGCLARKNPRRFRRGFRVADESAISDRRFPAARHSRPGPAAR